MGQEMARRGPTYGALSTPLTVGAAVSLSSAVTVQQHSADATYRPRRQPTCTAECLPPAPPAVLPDPCRKLEDQLDQKMGELIMLRKAAFEHNRAAAQKDVRLETAAEGQPGGEADWEIPAVFAGAAAGPQQVPDSEWGGSEASSPLARRYGSSEWAGGGSGCFGPAASAAAVDSLQRQLEELRLQAGQQQAAAAEREAQWQRKAEALRTQVQQAQQEARQQQQQLVQQQQQQQQDGGGGGGRAGALAAQCDSLSKERDALRTILDRCAKLGCLAMGAARASV